MVGTSHLDQRPQTHILAGTVLAEQLDVLSVLQHVESGGGQGEDQLQQASLENHQSEGLTQEPGEAGLRLTRTHLDTETPVRPQQTRPDRLWLINISDRKTADWSNSPADESTPQRKARNAPTRRLWVS